ncbi:MAG: RNA methyltransferase [Planctomycetota bacterium]
MPHPNIVPVSDLSDPRLEPYRDQRDQWLRARHRHWMEGREPPGDATPTGMKPSPEFPGGLFMAEGVNVVRQLIQSPHRTVSVLVSEPRAEAFADVFAELPAEVPVFVAPRAQIDVLTGFEIHRGLLACGARVDLGDWSRVAAASGAAVVLENLANHDNVGGIFRSVRALARPRAGFEHAACVLLSPRSCDPLYRKALRVSMGNALHVPFATIEPWPDAIDRFVRGGFVPVALDPSARNPEVAELSERFRAGSERPALVMGTEGPGLRPETVERVRTAGGVVARLDIEPAADSLNVGVAAAIALRELGGRRPML